jgi:hypothetical protein
MADCNKIFISYEGKISLPSSKETNIVTKHKALRDVIEAYFKAKDGYKIPDFFIQGSYKMKLMVQKKDNTYDVDLGVYFKEKPSHTCTTVQEHVLKAVEKHTTGGAKHLKKCIRVIYAGDFNIDLPVYYQAANEKQAKLAIKNGEWRADDPEEFVKWFDNHRKQKEIKNDGQLVRVVKYLKRWANERSFKTPSGAALTVWAAENFVPKSERDDIALCQTIKAIKKSLYWSISCKCPVAPFDDLLSNLDTDQKSKFNKALTDFCNDAERATTPIEKEPTSINLWKKHLGDKFTL